MKRGVFFIIETISSALWERMDSIAGGREGVVVAFGSDAWAGSGNSVSFGGRGPVVDLVDISILE